jgi:hypothetical protein
VLTRVFVKLVEEIKIKESRKHIMTNDDIKYRQGRSKRQVDNNEKLMFVSSIGLGIVILGIIIWGLITHG